CHTGHELAYRGHLFRVHEFRLQNRDIGDVGHHGHEAVHLSPRTPHGAQVDREAADNLASTRERQLEVVHSFAFENTFDCAAQHRPVRREHYVLEAGAYEIAFLAARDLAAATVGIAHKAGGIDHGDEALRVIQNLRVEVVLAQELRLHVLHFRNVEKNTSVLHDFASIVTNDKAVGQDVNDRTVPTQQRKFVVSQAAKLIQGSRHQLSVCRFNVQILCADI